MYPRVFTILPQILRRMLQKRECLATVYKFQQQNGIIAPKTSICQLVEHMPQQSLIFPCLSSNGYKKYQNDTGSTKTSGSYMANDKSFLEVLIKPICKFLARLQSRGAVWHTLDVVVIVRLSICPVYKKQKFNCPVNFL